MRVDLPHNQIQLPQRPFAPRNDVPPALLARFSLAPARSWRSTSLWLAAMNTRILLVLRLAPFLAIASRKPPPYTLSGLSCTPCRGAATRTLCLFLSR